MSSFDNGFAVGYVLGKKSGGSCPPPEITPPFSYMYLIGEQKLTEHTPVTPETPTYGTLLESI